MQGDIAKRTFRGPLHTLLKLWSQGGIKRFYRGAGWRTMNLVGTIYIANVCRMHLPSLYLKYIDSDGG